MLATKHPPKPERDAVREVIELLSEALSSARSIESESDRNWALRVIAKAQASTGDIQDALSTARSIEDAFWVRDSALRVIATAQTNAGDIQGALSTARDIKEVNPRVEEFSSIAKAQASAGDTRGATRTISRRAVQRPKAQTVSVER